MTTMPTDAPSAASPARTPGGRVFNFSAGPAVLPEKVIEEVQRDLWDFRGCGMGVCELSHRGKEFDTILQEAFEFCREVGKVPENYRIIFFQGGATTQTSMIPTSFLPQGATADYLKTGKWAKEAIKEAKKIGTVHLAFDSEDTKFDRLPTGPSDYDFSADAAYLWFCSNNTIYGTEFKHVPPTSAPVVRDASSDMYSRPVDWAPLSMVYASAQKNLGPSGQALVIARDDFLAKAPLDESLPIMWDYNVQFNKESRSNTPNTFAIYMMGRVFKWILDEFGSLEEVERYNEEKAALVYDAIDHSDGFYIPHAKPESRSIMNVTFRCPTEELDAAFIKEAGEAGFKTISGHRSIKGMRASIYNAMPIDGCRQLAAFMKAFQQNHA
ncbi:MAG: 3-phosphoserine/phosphohydroxythreonine transaminase [Planctomycetota bacterium]